ncbi:MAG: hypothetical protein KME14_26615 [Tildeniella torsiva UHER 1998/13D]|jgi:hypothetical protein|nr:hypothetical protein [Tildeniella torsiva UHER 1998/13D]
MNHPHAPTTGATFSCPCNLSSIKPSLQALAAKAEANGGHLTPTQAQLYLQLYQGWQYHRASQPARFRGEVDGLCDAIGSLPVVVMAA